MKKLTRRLAITGTILTATGLALTACVAAPASSGQLQAFQTILTSCPTSTVPAAAVREDVSGSRRQPALTGQDRQAVIDAVTRTAICGHPEQAGHFRFDIFSNSSASSVPLINTDLPLAGATDTARLRRVPDLVAATMAIIDAAYPQALTQVTDGGTDVVAQFVAGNDYITQLNNNRPAGSEPFQLQLTVLTDGIGTTGAAITDSTMTAEQATALANSLPVPALPGSTITFAGIGQTNGTKPPTEFVDGLKAFYTALGERTGANTVTVVTEYTPEGQ
jgi:hypothetical protein